MPKFNFKYRNFDVSCEDCSEAFNRTLLWVVAALVLIAIMLTIFAPVMIKLLVHLLLF